MKKLFPLLILALAVAFQACEDEKESRLPYVEFAQSAPLQLTMDNSKTTGVPLAVKVKLSEPSNADIRIPFYVTGTAQAGIDYELDADAFIIPAGEKEGKVDIWHLDITPDPAAIRITLQPSNGYRINNNEARTFLVSVGERENIIVNFTQSEYVMQELNQVDLEIVLTGEKSGDAFVAPTDMEFTAIFARGSHMATTGAMAEILFKTLYDEEGVNIGDKFIIPAGENSAKVTLQSVVWRSNGTADPSDGTKYARIAVVPDVNGVITADTAKVYMTQKTEMWDELVGEWRIASVPLKHSRYFRYDSFKTFIESEGDDIDETPWNMEMTDKITIAKVGDEYIFTPEIEGDLGNYLKYETPMTFLGTALWGGQWAPSSWFRPGVVVEMDVNYSFSADPLNEERVPEWVYFGLNRNLGEGVLEVQALYYNPTDFFLNIYNTVDPDTVTEDNEGITYTYGENKPSYFGMIYTFVRTSEYPFSEYNYYPIDPEEE